MNRKEKIVKLTLATVVAYIIADFLKLSYASSAGVIAILSVLDTRKTTLKIARERFYGIVLSFIIAIIVFYFLGYTLLSFSLFLILYLGLSHYLNLTIGIAPSVVLVIHFFTKKSIAVPLLINEFLLFFIGVGVALIVNIYMSGYDKDIEIYHLKVEKRLKEILLRFAVLLKQGNGQNDGKLIDELDEVLDKALDIVYQDSKNHLIHQTNYHVHFFEMRRQQNQLLREMAISMNNFQFDGLANHSLAQLFIETSHQLSQENPGSDLLAKIDETLIYYRDIELPKTRQEFESRAVLYHLIKDLERFIMLKVDFYKHYHLD